jgi:hypothetical protein
MTVKNPMTVKRVGVLSVGKVLGCLYVVLGVIVGGLFSLLSSTNAAVGGRDQGVAALLFGGNSIIIVPVIYGVIGFIGGIIGAALYNVVATTVGGIEIELGQEPGEYPQ